MKIKKGKLPAVAIAAATRFVNITVWLCCLSLSLAGCIHWPDIATDCSSYGVRPDNRPMGVLVGVEPLYHDELSVRCEGAKVAVIRIHPAAEVRGCVIAYENGTVEAFYSIGDQCAMLHELCHAAHGPSHTEAYEQDLQMGHPLAYCPRNQLKSAD